ncbi:PilZ domain-containing protein [Deltaproteobacteria bacterium]|nr:PilZ domain-containing protein [Deltaproteobacteria bacterium]
MKMPKGEQYTLLSELEERFSKLKRKHYRKPVRTSVEYSAGDRTDKGFIHDISVGGVFIETRMPFRAKEEISLNFSLSADPEKQIRIHGQIARISPEGVGVKFMSFDEDQREFLKSQMEEELI